MNFLKLFFCSAVFCLATSAFAAPKVELNTKVFHIIEVEENGQMVKRQVETGAVTAGEELIYRLQYRNSGDETATNVVLNNPIPESGVYVANSATAINSNVTFSVDDGKTYKQQNLLTYSVTQADGSVKQEQVSAEQYTHVRWVINDIAPGAAGEVSFKVLVK